MSDSEDTEPAIDDFESRFLEIDELSDAVSSDSDYLPSLSYSGNKLRTKPVLLPAQVSQKYVIEEQLASSSRVQRLRRKPRLSPGPSPLNANSESIVSTTNLVRTRMGYQHSQSSLWSLDDMTKSQSEAPVIPTPEQQESRNKKIVRRRESAKHKAEMEKMQTVEKLLRINSEFTGGSANVFWKGKRKKPTNHPISATDGNGNLDSKSKNYSTEYAGIKTLDASIPTNSLYPPTSLDPPTGYVRVVSSSRLTPHCMLSLPPATDLSIIFPSLASYQNHRNAQSRVCENCRIHLRKYACPITGASLCSLECYKRSSSKKISPLIT